MGRVLVPGHMHIAFEGSFGWLQNLESFVSSGRDRVNMCER